MRMSIKPNDIFKIGSSTEFEQCALETFRYQYTNNEAYREFCNYLKRTKGSVNHISEIPFLPISFFKSIKVATDGSRPEIVFTSSGTTGERTSQHYVKDTQLYRTSYMTAFEYFYGPISDYCVLALLPSYLEREGSSLIYMVDDLIKKSGHRHSGFYLNNLNELEKKISELEFQGQKTLLIGVSFALLDLVKCHQFKLKHTTIMETGGMKGRRKEIVRQELHRLLQKGFGVSHIHSEYGMTELLSQAYSKGNGIFECPPWMKVMARDTEDPLSFSKIEKTGGINVIDLANRDSCSFIATQDLGKVYNDGSFEVLGRFDHSDIRGCNLMAL